MFAHSVSARNDRPCSHSAVGGAPRLRPIVRLVSLSVTAVLTAALSLAALPALAGAPGHGPKAPDSPERSYNVLPATPGADPLWGLGVSNSALDPNALQNAMGRTFQAQGIYTPLTGWDYPIASAQTAANNGARIYLNINSWRLVSGKKVCYKYANYVNHDYDAYLQKWVDDLQAFGYDDTYVTFTHEPTANSNSQPSCGSAAEYVQAYDYVYHYFRNHGITYPFVWWMVASSFRNHSAHEWQPPAADFSIVAVDGYNRFLNGFWRTPDFIFQPAEDYAAALGKPLDIGEIGTVEDGAQGDRKATWISSAAGLFRTWSTDAILWNDAKGYRPDSSSASLTAWVAASQMASSSFLANADGHPGSTGSTWAAGFQPGETIDVRLNTLSGALMGSKVADASGAANPIGLHLPSPMIGGVHVMLAIGRTSGTIAQAQLAVSPPDSPTFAIAAGDTYTYDGVGFLPGENVTVAFPNGPLVSQTADSLGSVHIDAVSPPEPAEGGDVTVSAPSASLSIHFHTIALVHAPDASQPQQEVPVSVTGFGASENVNVKIGTTVLATLPTDRWGSAAGLLPLDTTFGRHTIVFTGASSQVSKQSSILLHATMSLSPTSGPSGTTVRVTSGPGWVPNETVRVEVAGTLVATATADANGYVNTSIQVIRKTLGDIHVTVYGLTLKLTATADFTVT